ncbi:bifunctional folylpolyglutamate synthase/dihydrofolate synthase [Sporohalobacter salinus]|uniref:bifunctional folylpolyglutamate synthase/dihydrofolate synthase n=1 Tax=Sporohalobacter salinus TaxID=1494606 RepID=UPI0019611AC3|nr:folylpolyglutamate synthase/dihydrofolate synthase family protein [Sporohalobacter salinus]MBM7623064.1 dihydrofolate synthase/folylpolyglutamate synthase [Sporohalobacter salinus]
MEDAVEYLNELDKFGVKPGLERIEILLDYLDNPQDKIDIIQVGGSNGKGSTSVMISSILTATGYKVGTYNSPEIVSFYERMRIDGDYIAPAVLNRLTKKIWPYLKKIEKQGLGHPTFFEVVTAIAFKYFAEEEVDIAVMEVGLGGRLDATNLTDNLVAAITNISREHTEYLGDSIIEIAAEKGGIINQGGKLVTGVKNEVALNKLKEISVQKEVEMIDVNKELELKRLNKDLKGQCFKIKGRKDYGKLQLDLLGSYQQQNLKVALGVITALPERFKVTVDNIRQGLTDLNWPGRLELLGKNPLVILDGAHNPSGARELKRVIEEDLGYQQLILVLGILADKDIKEMLNILTPLADKIILTKNTNKRASDPYEVAKALKDRDKEVEVVPKVAQAAQKAIDIATPGDLVSISGSLYTIAEARKFLVKNIIN